MSSTQAPPPAYSTACAQTQETAININVAPQQLPEQPPRYPTDYQRAIRNTCRKVCAVLVLFLSVSIYLGGMVMIIIVSYCSSHYTTGSGMIGSDSEIENLSHHFCHPLKYGGVGSGLLIGFGIFSFLFGAVAVATSSVSYCG